MFEPSTADLEADELRLAQLACGKLLGMVQGALSIGLPALQGGIPEPRDFLEERFRVLTGFALVLHSVTGKPGGEGEILRLRDRSRQVLAALDDLRQRLLEYLDRSQDPARTLAPARQAASALCDSLGAYADLMQLDRSRINRVRDVVFHVFDALENWDRAGEPTTA